jgi:hypothetical protein
VGHAAGEDEFIGVPRGARQREGVVSSCARTTSIMRSVAHALTWKNAAEVPQRLCIAATRALLAL